MGSDGAPNGHSSQINTKFFLMEDQMLQVVEIILSYYSEQMGQYEVAQEDKVHL